MNTFVWIMITFGASANLVFGPEFKTKELCENAANVVKKESDSRTLFNNLQLPFCVRIEK